MAGETPVIRLKPLDEGPRTPDAEAWAGDDLGDPAKDDALRRLRVEYEDHIRQVEGTEPESAGTPLRLFSSEYERLSHEALQIERGTIITLRNQDVISDEVLRRTGFRIFEPICSKRGADGRPESLWDRKTGAVNPKVAADWREHDIGYQLVHRWKELEPKLAGRIRIVVGADDELGLAAPVALLHKDLEAIGADVSITIGPGGHQASKLRVSPKTAPPAMFDRFRQWREHEKSAGWLCWEPSL